MCSAASKKSRSCCCVSLRFLWVFLESHAFVGSKFVSFWGLHFGHDEHLVAEVPVVDFQGLFFCSPKSSIAGPASSLLCMEACHVQHPKARPLEEMHLVAKFAEAFHAFLPNSAWQRDRSWKNSLFLFLLNQCLFLIDPAVVHTTPLQFSEPHPAGRAFGFKQTLQLCTLHRRLVGFRLASEPKEWVVQMVVRAKWVEL